MKFYNNNPSYGDAGPHAAESKEELANEMQWLFKEWAEQAFDDMYPEDRPEYDSFVASEINRQRAEFIAGLEEVD